MPTAAAAAATTRRKGVDTLKIRAHRTLGRGINICNDQALCYLIYGQFRLTFDRLLRGRKNRRKINIKPLRTCRMFSKKICLKKTNRKVFNHTEVILDLDTFLGTRPKLKYLFRFILIKLIDHHNGIVATSLLFMRFVF